MGTGGGASDIIHAAGVRVALFIIRAEGAHSAWLLDSGLSGRRRVGELMPQVAEVVLADAQFAHLIDHRKEVRQ